MTAEELERRVNAAFQTGKYMAIRGKYIQDNNTSCCAIGSLLLESGCTVDPNDEDWIQEEVDSLCETLGLGDCASHAFISGFDGINKNLLEDEEDAPYYMAGQRLAEKWVDGKEERREKES